MKKAIASITVILLLVAQAACGEDDSDPAGPTIADIAGSYEATTFAATINGNRINLLEEGASLNIDLIADGTTSGRLFIPDRGEEGGDLEADMVGTWTVSGDTVDIEQSADTFVRDTPFIVESGRLSGVNEQINIVLERQ